jgi:diaminopropionate ammonia-lyase
VPGPFTTCMGGLRCGEVSPLAFEAAFPLVHAYLGVEDTWAFDAMRLLANPTAGDPAIEAGPSGAAALAGVLAVLRDADASAVKARLALGTRSTVVVVASEGVTDPALWREVMGRESGNPEGLPRT